MSEPRCDSKSTPNKDCSVNCQLHDSFKGVLSCHQCNLLDKSKENIMHNKRNISESRCDSKSTLNKHIAQLMFSYMAFQLGPKVLMQYLLGKGAMKIKCMMNL